MKKIIIDGQEYPFNDGETILEVCRRNNIFIPTLCEMKDLGHHPAVCRVCLVRAHRQGGAVPVSYVASCDTPAEEGVEIFTRSPDVLERRRNQLDLIMAEHNEKCTTCSRLGDCELMDASLALRLEQRIFPDMSKMSSLKSTETPIVYDSSRCIRCQRCITVCRDVQGLSALEFSGRGENAVIRLRNDLSREQSPCISCGQCIMVCPTGAMRDNDDTGRVLDYLADPDTITVFQMAPSVRVGFSNAYNLPADSNLEGQLVAALRRLGADVVLDTNFGADVTIMEEGFEVLDRIKSGFGVTFTSCCPGWVNFMEKNYPDMCKHLSSVRSPQGCLSSLIKQRYVKERGWDVNKVKVISIMPCTAKKEEAARPQLSANGIQDTDAVLTIRELNRLIRRHGIYLDRLEPEKFDSLMSEYSGAGAIFGATGGVMEAALRTAYWALNDGKELEGVEFPQVRGMDQVRSAEIDLGKGGKIRVAVCYGLNSAREIVEAIRSGKEKYDFVEVMACPGGCISGGGHLQTKRHYRTLVQGRSDTLYKIDRKMPNRQSHNNEEIKQLYKDFLGKPNSHLAHELLHTHFTDRKRTQKVTLKTVVADRTKSMWK